MRITLSGATGFLGNHLVTRLLADGHSLRMLTRHPVTNLPPNVETFLWNPPRVEPPPGSFDRTDAVIHLAGASVNQRWTPQAKALLKSSRLDSTRSILHSLSTLSKRPPLFLSASAIGIYGDRGEEILTEESSSGKGFLAELTNDWEREASLARALGVRVNTLRTGMVLGLEGGALPSLLPVFRLGAGGKLGNGQQWMSWIHVDDWTSAVIKILNEGTPPGPVNLTSPEPVRNEDFTNILGKVLRRPAFLKVPEFALKMIFGEMSSVVLGSQRVFPEVLQKSQFHFNYPGLESALRSLLQ